MNTRSGSILRRLFLSFSLVSVPLGFGLLLVLYLVDDVNARGRATVDGLTLMLESGDGLVESVDELEHSAREYLLLGSQPFYQQMQARHEQVRRHLANLGKLDLNDGLEDMIDEAARLERELYTRITGDQQPPGDATRDVVRRLVGLQQLTRRIYARGSGELGEEIAAMQRAGETNVRVIGLLVIGLFLFTFLLALIVTQRLSRPIGIIDSAIKRMGQGDFQGPIRVDGPQDIKALAERLEWLRRRLGEIDAEKETFLLHMSHELKSPVTSLHEGVGILHEQLAGPLNGKQQEIARILFENIYHLRTLIDNYINHQALTLNARQAIDRPVRLDQLAENVMASIRQTNLHKGLAFRVRLEEVYVQGDPDRLRLVLTNLLSNAVKFSPAGSRVSLNLEMCGERVLIEVSDSGPGVPEAEKQAVFQAFFQGSASRDEHIQGTGLGLSIVREYVEQYGGEVSVSDGEPGAVFRVLLPGREKLTAVA